MSTKQGNTTTKWQRSTHHHLPGTPSVGHVPPALLALRASLCCTAALQCRRQHQYPATQLPPGSTRSTSTLGDWFVWGFVCVCFPHPTSFSNADQSQISYGSIKSSCLLCWGLLQSSVELLKPWQKRLEVLTFQKSFSRTQQDKTAQKRYLTREKNKVPKRQPKGFGFSFLSLSFSREKIKNIFFWRIYISSPPALFVFFGPFTVSWPTKLLFI